MKNLSFILMLLIITASACKKDKSQPTSVAVVTPNTNDTNTTNTVKPNDTPEAKTVITTYYGKTQYISTLVPPNRIDTTYVDSFTVTENFKDSTIAFSGSFTSETFKMSPSNQYSSGWKVSHCGYLIGNGKLRVKLGIDASAAGAAYLFYGEK